MATPNGKEPSAYERYLEEQQRESLSALPPRKFKIAVGKSVRTVLLIRSNKGIRAYYQALQEQGLIRQQAVIETAAAQRSGGDDETVGETARRVLNYEQQGSYMGCMLYGLTRQHHPDLTLSECLEAVPGGPAAFAVFAEALNDALQAHSAPAKKADSDANGANPTTAPKPKAKGGRSSTSKSNSRSRSSNAASRRKTSGV